MLIKLNKVPNSGLYSLQETMNDFFKNMITSTAYGKHLIPVTFHPVYDSSPKLQEIMEDVYKKSVGVDRKLLYRTFINNNRVQRLCSCNSLPLLELNRFPKSLQKSIHKLFSHLYKSTLNTKIFKSTVSNSLHDHYKTFRSLNTSKVCPFCGLENYPEALPNHRTQYDHYLDIGTYPFAGVNFNNLIPMCSICNEAPNKHSKNILFREKNKAKPRRLVYYPFSDVGGIEVRITNRNKSSVGYSGKWKVFIKPSQQVETEKVSTWISVFNIVKRFQARIEEDHKSWLTSYFIDLGFEESDLLSRSTISECRDSLRNKANKIGDQKLLKLMKDLILEEAYFDYLSKSSTDNEIESIKLMANTTYTKVLQERRRALFA